MSADPRRLDCLCGHAIYTHGRIAQDGNHVWGGCKTLDCPCTKFRCRDGSLWPLRPAGEAAPA